MQERGILTTDDNYTRHGGGTIGPLLQNDSDPEGDPMHVQIETFPTQGQLFGLDGNSFTYALNSQSFTGTDSFTYKACDWNNACSGVATVTITIVNAAPVASGDFYTVHGGTTIGPMMVNDSDPDGDPINWNFVTAPLPEHYLDCRIRRQQTSRALPLFNCIVGTRGRTR